MANDTEIPAPPIMTGDGLLAGAPMTKPIHSDRPATSPYVLASESVILQGQPDNVADPSVPTTAENLKVVCELFPGYEDLPKHEHALSLYVAQEKSLREIADTIGLPIRTVVKWAEEGGWIAMQEKTVKTMRKAEKLRLDAIRIQHRERLMQEQVSVADQVFANAKDHIDAASTAGQLKMAAEAAKLASDMANRAMGIGESGKMDDDVRRTEEQQGKTALVVNFNGGLPPVKVVDVEVDDGQA